MTGLLTAATIRRLIDQSCTDPVPPMRSPTCVSTRSASTSSLEAACDVDRLLVSHAYHLDKGDVRKRASDNIYLFYRDCTVKLDCRRRDHFVELKNLFCRNEEGH